jgi:hypothetical protein
MRRFLGVLLLMPIVLSMPSNADFLLNCRLMTPDTKETYRRHCKWETVVKCEPGKACIIKRQNFVSGYSNAVLAANPQWLAAVSLKDRSSGLSTVAGISGPVGVPGTSDEILATGSEVGHELSDAVGDAVSDTRALSVGDAASDTTRSLDQ